ncbi:hypothetical protein ABIC71_001686 [Herbaspirillum seropedicae]|uniref:hypothetical protein n=1 Tax=Herbaspirillum seropedicae TaxID=964 RepID=UPI0033957BE4
MTKWKSALRRESLEDLEGLEGWQVFEGLPVCQSSRRLEMWNTLSQPSAKAKAEG